MGFMPVPPDICDAEPGLASAEILHIYLLHLVASEKVIAMASDMGTTQNIFVSNELSLRTFCFDSTYDSQWLYTNWFKSAHNSKWISENGFKLTHYSKSFTDILIHIDSWLEKLPRILIQINSWLKNLEYWFESSHDSIIRINCWFRWPFLGFHSISLTFFGFSLNFVYLFGTFTKFHWPFLGIQLSALGVGWPSG